jgi:hypothetical protein
LPQLAGAKSKHIGLALNFDPSRQVLAQTLKLTGQPSSRNLLDKIKSQYASLKSININNDQTVGNNI